MYSGIDCIMLKLFINKVAYAGDRDTRWSRFPDVGDAAHPAPGVPAAHPAPSGRQPPSRGARGGESNQVRPRLRGFATAAMVPRRLALTALGPQRRPAPGRGCLRAGPRAGAGCPSRAGRERRRCEGISARGESSDFYSFTCCVQSLRICRQPRHECLGGVAEDPWYWVRSGPTGCVR